MFYFLIFLSFLTFLFWLAWFLFNKAWQKGFLFGHLNFVLLEIRFPKFTAINEENGKLQLMEQLYNSIGSILRKEKSVFGRKPYIVFEIAIPEEGKEIGFYFAVSKKFHNIVQKQIKSFFPEADIEMVNDFNIFNRRGAVSGSVLKMKYDYLPFQTYKKLEHSTLKLITNAISSLKEKGEGIAFQILTRQIKENLFEVNIRILASAETKENADQILSGIENSFAQFEFPDLNNFYSLRPQDGALKKLIHNFSFRLFNKKEKICLTAEELTGIFHWPIVEIETPEVKFLKAKAAAPPAIAPTFGIILGKNHFKEQETAIKLSSLDRRRHLYVVGQIGTGKNCLLKNLIKQDIDSGAGIGIIDPHEDLVDAISELVPYSRRNNTVIYDAANREHTINFDDIIKNEKILFIKNGSSFGPAIMAKLHTAAIEHARRLGRLPQRDFYLYYMDGLNNSTANSIATILPEFKKYHINFTLIDSCADELTEENRDLILSNIGSLVSFRVNPENAGYLAKYFKPIFNESDLINIDNEHAYVKLMINGAGTAPFNIKVEEIKKSKRI